MKENSKLNNLDCLRDFFSLMVHEVSNKKLHFLTNIILILTKPCDFSDNAESTFIVLDILWVS